MLALIAKYQEKRLLRKYQLLYVEFGFFKHVRPELKFTQLISAIFLPNKLFVQTRRDTDKYSHSRMILKTAQGFFLFIKAWNIKKIVWLACVTRSNMLKLKMLDSGVFHPSKLFEHTKKYTGMSYIYMAVVSNSKKIVYLRK